MLRHARRVSSGLLAASQWPAFAVFFFIGGPGRVHCSLHAFLLLRIHAQGIINEYGACLVKFIRGGGWEIVTGRRPVWERKSACSRVSPSR